MSRKNWFVLLLVFTSAFSHKCSVFGDSVREQKFKRVDPLNGFRSYRGSFNITNKHYWASAAFTGIHGYAIAAVWVLCGIAYGSYMILKCSIGSSSPIVEHSSSSFLKLLLLALLFSSLAIAATGIVIAANQSCLYRTRRLRNTALGVATEARKTIQIVTQTMDEMQSLLSPYDNKTTHLLNATSVQLDGESRTIKSFVRIFERTINKGIHITYIINLVLVTINLSFVVAGIVLLLSHWRPGVLVIIILCWIFTTLCWILTGLDFAVQTFAKDTCSALETFKQNPQNNSLSSILPCATPLYSDKVLAKIGSTVHTSIIELNSKVSEFTQMIRSNEEIDNPNYVVPTICNPFSGAPNYSYTPDICPRDSMQIGDLPGVLSKFTCYEPTIGNCAHDGRFIPKQVYVMAFSYSNAIDKLIKIFPDLKSLLQCLFVKDSLSDIVLYQCEPYKASSRRLWISVLCLSVFMVILVLLLVAKAYQDRGRTWSWCSVYPIPEYRQR